MIGGVTRRMLSHLSGVHHLRVKRPQSGPNLRLVTKVSRIEVRFHKPITDISSYYGHPRDGK